jgi:methylthioribose-1-phosphate isomerase
MTIATWKLSPSGLDIDVSQATLRPFYLHERVVHVLDQRALPHHEQWLRCDTIESLAIAIETLAVRGAPAIGGAAALGMAMAMLQAPAHLDVPALVERCADADARLWHTRPTAVNLFAALAACRLAWRATHVDAEALRTAVVMAALSVLQRDAAACTAMASVGVGVVTPLLARHQEVLTICHTGALATCGTGTALGVVRALRDSRQAIAVAALETRPLLQGARLTSWECLRLDIPVTLLTDSMAPSYLSRGRIACALVGADRIARNGDTANKIGTYALAVACRHHGVPLYVVAPTTTIDVSTATGLDIVVEERAGDEVRQLGGVATAPRGVPVWNPAFDVTPASLITGFITEAGLLSPPFADIS